MQTWSTFLASQRKTDTCDHCDAEYTPLPSDRYEGTCPECAPVIDAMLAEEDCL